MLKCETNTPEIETEILAAFDLVLEEHEDIETVFEHGQWHITCTICGAQWSVNDANTKSGYCFEVITEGDEVCLAFEEYEDDYEGEDDLDVNSECYFDNMLCSGESWVCETCGETYCSFHNHQTSKGDNVECSACERTRIEQSEEEE